MSETTQVEKTRGTTPPEGEQAAKRRAWIPRTDIYETKEAIVLVADMPGVDEASVEITLEKGVLTLDGRAEVLTPRVGMAATHREYEAGDYHRAFNLSEDVDRDKIEATVKNGVLRLVLPKARAQTRKIAVKTD